MFKNIVLAIGFVCAHRLHHHPHSLIQQYGIDHSELMSGSHWRKSWPEGIDDSTDDGAVMNIGNDAPRRTEKAEPERVKYDFTLEDEILDSQRHLKKTEEGLGKEFGKDGYQDRGYAIINSSSDKRVKSRYL